MNRSSLLLGLLSLSPHYPPWLFGLRFAAQLASAILLVFGLFLILLNPGWPVLVYALLMLLFGVFNLATFKQLKTSVTEPRHLRWIAHACSLLLPLAYVAGASRLENGFAWNQLLAVATPTVLSILAIEQSLQWRRRTSHKT